MALKNRPGVKHATLAAGLIISASSLAFAAPDLHTGLYRGHAVTYVRIGNRDVFEGDILLDHVTPLPGAAQAKPGMVGLSVGIAYGQYFWPKNAQGVAQIPYIVTNGATALNSALSQFNQTFPNLIQFVARTTETDYVNFDFDSANHNGSCDSYVGRIGGEQSVGGSVDCNLGTLLHEMGHTLGLFHEQSRPDRDTYVSVEYGNIIKGSEGNFDQLIDNYQDLGPYDYASIMHYIPYAFTRNGGPTIESIPPGMPLSNLVGYTAADKDGIERLYSTAPKTVTIASNPPGLAVSVDGSPVTTPQTFTWKLNSTHTLAVASTAQTLSGTTYVYGRWNDSTAASHSIKLTRGNKTLAEPATSPAVTVYTANFIQLASTTSAVSPAGAGTMSASPAPLTYSGATGNFYVARQAITLSAAGTGSEKFLTWGGTPGPYSENPYPVRVPDDRGDFNVTAYFTTKPVTTIATQPPGLGMTVDGQFWYAPQSFASDYFSGWGTGSTHTIATYTPQQPYSINTRYVYNAWSDGGALSHSITAAAIAATYTASFTPQYVPIAYATPSCAATVAITPSSPDGFYAQGTKVTVASTAASGWVLTGWLDDLAGRKPTQTLTVNDEELAIANYNTSKTPLSITKLSPATLSAGAPAQTLTITGKGFTSSSAVFINNAYQQPNFVSSAELTVTLPAADLATAGAFPIAISNFPPNAPCGAYLSHNYFVTTP